MPVVASVIIWTQSNEGEGQQQMEETRATLISAVLNPVYGLGTGTHLLDSGADAADRPVPAGAVHGRHRREVGGGVDDREHHRKIFAVTEGRVAVG